MIGGVPVKAIESIEQWYKLSVKLIENGYQIWQMQYDTRAPEGFHAWFYLTGKPEFEIVTHNDAVHDAIIKYR